MQREFKAPSKEVIVLWSHPRSGSTAFSKPFVNQNRVKLIHEPFADVWHYGRETFSPNKDDWQHPGQTEHHNATLAESWKSITAPSQTGLVLIKDHAKWMIPTEEWIGRPNAGNARPNHGDGNPTVIPTKDLLAPHILHVFLIRDPIRGVGSYLRVMNEAVPNFSQEWLEQGIGLRESKLLYHFIASKKGAAALVIDYDDLLANPADMLRQFCRAAGVDFHLNMLNWPQNADRKENSNWHVTADRSTGFAKPKPLPELHTVKGADRPLANRNIEYYDFLKKRAIKPSPLLERSALAFAANVRQNGTRASRFVK